ncbi:MAG: hypothetical protein RL033_6586 [Pseudomonadota bacterium]
MSTKGRLLRLLSSLVLAEGEVVAVRAFGSNLRLVQLRAKGSGGGWQPGDKLQLLLPEDEVRTFTPLHWDAAGSTALLVYTHGDGPAARWAPLLAEGQRLRFVGPSRSLTMPDGPITLIGDETSLAVAASYARARPGKVRAIFEVAAEPALGEALHAVGLEQAMVVHREPGAPRGQALANDLPELQGPIGITGGADLIQSVRTRLRERGLRDTTTKAYWVQGRTGLD